MRDHGLYLHPATCEVTGCFHLGARRPNGYYLCDRHQHVADEPDPLPREAQRLVTDAARRLGWPS